MTFNAHQFDTLQKRLSKLGFKQWPLITLEEVTKGAILPYSLFCRFIFTEAYPTASAYLIKRHSWFAVEAQERALIEVSFRVLDVEFGFKPAITLTQFFKEGSFAGHKVDIVLNLLTFMSRLCASVIANSTKHYAGNEGAPPASSNSSALYNKATTAIGNRSSSNVLCGNENKGNTCSGSGPPPQQHVSFSAGGQQMTTTTTVNSKSFGVAVRSEQELRVIAQGEKQKRVLRNHNAASSNNRNLSRSQPSGDQLQQHPHYLNETTCSVANSSCSRVSRGTSCVSERQKEVQERQMAIRTKLEELHQKHRQLNRQSRQGTTTISNNNNGGGGIMPNVESCTGAVGRSHAQQESSPTTQLMAKFSAEKGEGYHHTPQMVGYPSPPAAATAAGGGGGVVVPGSSSSCNMSSVLLPQEQHLGGASSSSGGYYHHHHPGMTRPPPKN